MSQSLLSVLLSIGTFVAFGGLGYTLNRLGLDLVKDDANGTEKLFVYVVFGAIIFLIAAGIFLILYIFFYHLIQQV